VLSPPDFIHDLAIRGTSQSVSRLAGRLRLVFLACALLASSASAHLCARSLSISPLPTEKALSILSGAKTDQTHRSSEWAATGFGLARLNSFIKLILKLAW